MTIRSFFGGLFIIAGCTAVMLCAAAMMLSMQMQAGDGLLIGASGLVGGLAALVGGGAILLYQR